MSTSDQSWYRLPYTPVLIVISVLVGVMVLLSVAQRDEAGNEPVPAPGENTASSSATTGSSWFVNGPQT